MSARKIVDKRRHDLRQRRGGNVKIHSLDRANDDDENVIEAIGNPEKLEALLAALAPHDLREIVQSGTVAIGRGSRSITERALDRVTA